MFTAVLKTFALLVIAFVMLYVGMNNTHSIDFHFPIAGTGAPGKEQPLHASAALIYFGVFAIGVLAGTMLHTGKTAAAAKKGGKDK